MSRQDEGGDDKWTNNSQFRLLVGYERDLGEKFTVGIQYYLEHIVNYNEYCKSGPAGQKRREEDRHLFTLRLTKMLLLENLKLSLFTYFSPSNHDVYFRPNILYKFTDSLQGEVGGNLFAGEDRHTFFGQFGQNTNMYAGVRYSF